MYSDFKRDSGIPGATTLATQVKSLTPATAATFTVRNGDELASVLAKVQDKQTICLRPGVYADKKFECNANSVTIYSSVEDSPVEEDSRAVFKNAQLFVKGRACQIVRLNFDGTGHTSKSNMIQIFGESTYMYANTIKNIETLTDKTPVVVIHPTAHNSYFLASKVDNCNGYVVTLREGLEGSIATGVAVSRNSFRGCREYFFQAGQLGPAGRLPYDSLGVFSYNKVVDCNAAEIKVSRFSATNNYFENVKRGFNFRIGNNSELRHNMFVGGERASRLFGRGHFVRNNIVIKPTLYGFILPEGSLQSQFRVLDNAHHVVAQDIDLSGNYIESNARACFYIGDQQTGMLGTGTSRDRSSPDYPHYEPYSPSGIVMDHNTMVIGAGSPLVIRKPDTTANINDGYPKHESSNKYIGLRSISNKILLRSDLAVINPSAELYAEVDDIIG